MSRILVAKTTHSDSTTHEQTIISKHLFVRRVVVSLPKKEEKIHGMMMLILAHSQLVSPH